VTPLRRATEEGVEVKGEPGTQIPA